MMRNLKGNKTPGVALPFKELWRQPKGYPVLQIIMCLLKVVCFFFLRILKINESFQPTLHKGRLTSLRNASYVGSRAAQQRLCSEQAPWWHRPTSQRMNHLSKWEMEGGEIQPLKKEVCLQGPLNMLISIHGLTQPTQPHWKEERIPAQPWLPCVSPGHPNMWRWFCWISAYP